MPVSQCFILRGGAIGFASAKCRNSPGFRRPPGFRRRRCCELEPFARVAKPAHCKSAIPVIRRRLAMLTAQWRHTASRKRWRENAARGSPNYRVGARSAAGSMTALSLASNVREHRFQMHHYRNCAGNPLMSWRVEPLSLLIFLCRGVCQGSCWCAKKESDSTSLYMLYP